MFANFFKKQLKRQLYCFTKKVEQLWQERKLRKKERKAIKKERKERERERERERKKETCKQ
jgi:hypothetical protein